MIIGITGLIGSGKTTIAKIFGRHHFSRIDADEISRKFVDNNKALKARLIKNFGNEILGKKKSIDRKKLGNLVFNNNKKLKILNSIMHPIIINEIKKQIEKIRKKCGNDAKIVVDAPLLLETDAGKLADKIIVVNASSENRIRRSRRFSKWQLEKISKRQMPLDEKLKKADFIIDNTKDLKYLEKQVKEIAEKLNQ